MYRSAQRSVLLSVLMMVLFAGIVAADIGDANSFIGVFQIVPNVIAGFIGAFSSNPVTWGLVLLGIIVGVLINAVFAKAEGKLPLDEKQRKLISLLLALVFIFGTGRIAGNLVAGIMSLFVAVIMLIISVFGIYVAKWGFDNIDPMPGSRVNSAIKWISVGFFLLALSGAMTHLAVGYGKVLTGSAFDSGTITTFDRVLLGSHFFETRGNDVKNMVGMPAIVTSIVDAVPSTVGSLGLLMMFIGGIWMATTGFMWTSGKGRFKAGVERELNLEIESEEDLESARDYVTRASAGTSIPIILRNLENASKRLKPVKVLAKKGWRVARNDVKRVRRVVRILPAADKALVDRLLQEESWDASILQVLEGKSEKLLENINDIIFEASGGPTPPPRISGVVALKARINSDRIASRLKELMDGFNVLKSNSTKILEELKKLS